MADEKPPAPQSVMPVYSPASRAATSTSETFFCTIGAPIWTDAPESSPVLESITIEENVAPLRPSRPVLPPSATTRSPAACLRGCLPRGAMPAQPQYTRGLAA
jgi:hypothetical protein